MLPDGTQLTMRLDSDGILVLDGEIDSYSAALLSERLQDDPGVKVLDLAGISFIDSSGLRVLVAANQGRDGIDAIQLRSPSAAVQRLLEISGLTGHLDISG